MKEDPQRSQIHQRNAPPVIPTLPKINHQCSSSSTSSSVSNMHTVPTLWPNGLIFPPPYPPPPFVVGQEPIYYPDERHSWAIGLFDCFSDLKISFLVLLCPCVAFGKIAEIVNEGETIWTEPGSLYCFLYIVQVGFMEIVDFIWFILFKDRCIGSMSYQGWIIGFILATFYNGLYRTKLRRQWNLKGSLTSDYCLHLFCHQCALCQQYRQLEHQGFIVFQGWERNKERFRQTMTVMYPQAPPVVQEMSR
ncbi:Uncharacterized protein family Cys-rich [Cynara cardunculus var. scolymus]|uniref:Uncharacterized protein family Cys-rich n=1 Tax=Cynara cardunculus var. scolymus TaxID=59895 RepID=A0A103XJK9_CYNCS|nr:Uncharacterized protein family Cys-rich [Cynara cardunculus var. scolymus]